MPIAPDPVRQQQQMPARLLEGTVSDPPLTADGWLRVEIESQSGVTLVPWVPRVDLDTLPGDAVVVEESDEGNYWAVAWWPQNGQVSVPPSGTLTPATVTTEGIVRLSHAPVDPAHPVAVETADARMSDARTPLAHSHPESDVTNLVADLAAKEVKTAKGAANGYAPLDSGLLVPVANLPGATTLAKGVVQLTGDLAGTATAPTVPGLATKENTANKGAASGYAPLNASSKLPSANAPTMPQAKAHLSVNTAIVTATWTIVPLAAEDYDTANLHDNVTNNSRLTAPEAGLYLVAGLVCFAGNATGQRGARILKNGATLMSATEFMNNGTDYTQLPTVGQMQMAAGDYVELQCQQKSGANLNIQIADSFTPGTHLSMTKVST